jgi:hypothetical protein
MISALYAIALNAGAPRVVRGARIEHVCGNPGLTPEMDRDYGRRIVETALAAIQRAVTGPTLFDPATATPTVAAGAAS